ncbi:acyl-CoA reductase [Daejeonella lutea]|uniref:Acyl-CoA reductase (LuxC) n=1 Tax=Daejeonella lutea TaxID=572036 RepID=A0A1T5EXQ9_9SPHI|nr:acyl-CoA reductase [Daejeonella lutea]SKB88732.1 Acyl-CoA reductase (LuxC) [Daejeonella lutea]
MTEILTTKQRLEAFAKLGTILSTPDQELTLLINSAHQFNAWFTSDSTANAVKAIAAMLDRADLEKWIADPDKFDTVEPYSVGLILAGNIPLVGFHDILCVLVTGNIALIKLSSQDTKMIPYILTKLTEIEPGFKDQIKYIDRLVDFDAVIATGSNNTSRYFEYYFSKVPHVIRKNRNSVAILNGNESPAELSQLGHDIFDYFGLGCRNVSKLYVPRGYDFKLFFEGVESFKPIIDHHKYNNNYDYNKSIFLVNLDKHLDNGFLLLKEDERMASPLAVLYYQEYDDVRMLEKELIDKANHIQCVISSDNLSIKTIEPGDSQTPKLWDYADGVDTIAFLCSIK